MIILTAIGQKVIIPRVCEKLEKDQQFGGTIEGKEIHKKTEKEWPDR